MYPWSSLCIISTVPGRVFRCRTSFRASDTSRLANFDAFMCAIRFLEAWHAQFVVDSLSDSVNLRREMKASLRFRRVRWIRGQTQGEERGGQAICFSWGERNVCEEQEPPGTLRYTPHDWLAQNSQLTATLFLLYPHTAFAQTQKGTSINPTSTQTTSTDATDTPFRAGPEVPFPTLYRGTNPNRRFKKRQQGLHSTDQGNRSPSNWPSDT